MSILNRRFSRALAATSGLLACGFAQDAFLVGTAAAQECLPRPLAVEVRPGEIIGHEQIARVFITCGTNQFLFVQPAGLQAASPNAENLFLTSADGTFSIRLRVLESSDTDSAVVRSLKERFLAEHSSITNMEAFTTSIAGREAAGVQFRHTVRAVGTRLTKAVWMPCKAGILEISLSASPAKAKLAGEAFDFVLVTFASNEKGKLEIIRRIEQS